MIRNAQDDGFTQLCSLGSVQDENWEETSNQVEEEENEQRSLYITLLWFMSVNCDDYPPSGHGVTNEQSTKQQLTIQTRAGLVASSGCAAEAG